MKKMILAAAMASAMCAFGDFKVGTVDMMMLVRNHKSYDSNKQLLTTTEKDCQAKIDKLRDGIEEIQEEGKKVAEQAKNSVMLAQAQKDKIEKQLIEIQQKYVSAQQELRAEGMRAQQSLQELEGRLLRMTTEDLRKVIDAFADKNGYDLIIDVNAAAFSKKSLDVTERVLKDMGVTNPKKPGDDLKKKEAK